MTKLINLSAILLAFAAPLLSAKQSEPLPGHSTSDMITTPAFIQQLEQGNTQVVVFYGTSLTHKGAWVPKISAELEKKYPGLVTCYNEGQSGKTSIWGVKNLETRVLPHEPDVVFIEFSVNDATERFHLSQETSKENLNWIIDRILSEQPDCEIILQVMNPVIDRPEGNRGWRPELEAYQDVYREVAQERDLLLIDHMPAWKALLESDEATFRAYVPDGLHPNGKGYEAIMLPTLRQHLGL